MRAPRLTTRFGRGGLGRIGIGAEIDLDDPGIVRHLARQAIGNLLAVVQHHHAIDHAHQYAHDVLDPDDGDAKLVANLAQHVGGLVHLGVIEPAQAFVRQQQFRPGRKRLGQLQLLQAGGAQPVDTDGAVRRQADHGERAFGGVLGFRTAVPALPEVASQRHIVEYRQPVKRSRDLEGPADAAIDDPVRRETRDLRPGEFNRTRRRRKRAGEHVEDRALARAVRADQAEDLALIDLERYLVDGREAAKPFDQALDYQHGGPFRRSRTTYL